MKQEFVENVRWSTKYWWTGILVGLLSIFMGFWSLSSPLITLVALNLIFIAGFLASGIVDVIYAFSVRKESSDWWVLLMAGIVNLVLGFLLMSMKEQSVVVLLFYVGFSVLFHSISAIFIGSRLNRLNLDGGVGLIVLGVLGIILSFFLIRNFGFTASFIVTLCGFSLFLYGFTRIYYAFLLKRLKKKTNIE